MKTVTVQFDVDVPDTATDREIEEWIAFEIGASCHLNGSNPCSKMDLEAKPNTVYVH